MLTLLLAASFHLARPTTPLQDPVPATAVVAAKPAPAEVALAELKARDAASELGYKERAARFHAEYEAFAKKYAGSRAGMEAETKLFSSTWWIEEDKRSAAALERLAHIKTLYAKSEHLWMVVRPIGYLVDKSERDAALVDLAATNPHPAVKGAVLLQRAKGKKGPERAEMFERLAKDFAAVPYMHTTLGALANAHLHPHPAESLAVGQVAPEITGTDLNGNPMSLSDFRSKVVLLDFWGDW